MWKLWVMEFDSIDKPSKSLYIGGGTRQNTVHKDINDKIEPERRGQGLRMMRRHARR